MVQQRLPAVNGDDGVWGDILNQFLESEHYNNGADNVANGGHQTITVRPGTTAAGTAPIKLTSGPILTTPEAGAIEFNGDRLYFTQTTSTVRKVIAAYDDSAGAEGDMYYRDTGGNFVRFQAGSGTEVLRVLGGIPAWGTVPAIGSDGQIQYSTSYALDSSPNFTYDSAHSRLVIGENAVVLPNNPLAMVGDINSYLQINLQNKNPGSSASADYIITADNGNDTSNYADFGLNGSTANISDWDAAGPNDGYTWIDGGNLVLGSLTPTKQIKFGIASTNHQMHPSDVVGAFSSTGLDIASGKKYSIGGVELVPGGSSTSSNVGSSGVGVYKTKVGLDFKFKKIAPASSKITITDNTTNDTVDIDLGSVGLADLTSDSTHRVVTDAMLTKINNTSGTNTGDQVADGTTITGAGTVGSPFVASAQSDQSLKTTDSPTFANLTLSGLSTGQSVIDSNSVKTAIQELDFYAQEYAAGPVVAPSFTDNGNGSVTIGSGTYNLYKNADGTGAMKQYNITGNTFTLTDQSENYIYANYNSGSPVLSSTTNRALLTHTTTATCFTIYRDGTNLVVLDWDAYANATVNRMNRRNIYTNRFAVQTAPILSEVATRTVTIASGIVWFGVVNQSLNTFSSATDTLYYLRHVSGTWTKSTVTQYDNTHYDDGTNAQTLSAGNYAILFVYRQVSASNIAYIVLGAGDYNLAQAQASTPPSGLPVYIANDCILTGRIIVQKNAAAATQIDSAFTTVFASTPVSDHNQLSNRDVIGNHQRLVPIADSSTAIQFTKSDGTPVINIDTQNYGVYIAGVGTPSAASNAKFHAWDTANSWLQSTIQNMSSGNNASTDFVATKDTGTDTTGFINMGINSSGYSRPSTWTINGAGDGYMYTTGGNTAVGTDQNYVDIFTNGTLLANRVARFSSTGLSVTGTVAGSNLSGSNTGDQTGGTPAIVLGTTNTAGTSTNFLRRDDTILAFDATAPSTQNYGDSAVVGSATVAARRDHKHAMPASTKDTTGVTGILKGNGTTITAAANTDLPVMTASAGGAVPNPTGHGTDFLRGDGTWVTPAASGLSQQQVMAISSMRV